MDAPWLAFYPKDFLSSAKVQGMPHAARSIYLHLLFRSWGTEDCSIPSDTQSLMENSETTREEWETYGPLVLRNFVTTEAGKLRNLRLYREWSYAREIHEKRRAASIKANQTRWHSPNEEPLQADLIPNTHNGAKAVNPAAVGEEMEAATRIFEQLGIAADYGTREITAQTIRLRAASDPTSEGILAAERWLLGAARADQAAGETINRFYFSDQKYLHKKNGKKAALEAEARVGTWNGDSPPPQTLRSIVTDEYFERTKKSKANGETLNEFDEELLRQEGIA